MKRLVNFLNLTISQFFRSPEVRREVCAIAEACGGGGGGSTTPVNGLSNLEGGMGFGGQLTEEYTELTDLNTNAIFYFEQEENGDQEIELSTEHQDLYRTSFESRSRDDYSRIRSRVSRESDGFGVEFELDTDDGATIYDDIYQRGLGDADDYSENKTQYSYVTKKMLDEKTDVNIVSDSPDTDFSDRGFYTFTGTTGIWDLLPAETKTTTRYLIANMGSGNLTINAPINTIWEAGNLMSNTILAPGETMVIYSNGIYWTIYNGN